MRAARRHVSTAVRIARCRQSSQFAGRLLALCSAVAARRRVPPTTSTCSSSRRFRAAVDRVAPSVVRIETVGGLERVSKVLFGTGPTTGLVVDPDGYIVSSAFNFVNKPASILVRLPDGTRKPAKLVATDHNRMLVLLKIDADKPLPVPEIAPAKRDARRPVGDRRGPDVRERPAEHGRRHPQRPGPHLGQGHPDRRRRLAQQLRRAAGRHPRPRAGRARAALARRRPTKWPASSGTTRASASPSRSSRSSRSCPS